VIVVINTCPLTNLASIGQVDLLQRLYQQVAIAEGVCSELNAMENGDRPVFIYSMTIIGQSLNKQK
jgi:predicted nucleic acid-binding protein